MFRDVFHHSLWPAHYSRPSVVTGTVGDWQMLDRCSFMVAWELLLKTGLTNSVPYHTISYITSYHSPHHTTPYHTILHTIPYIIPDVILYLIPYIIRYHTSYNIPYTIPHTIPNSVVTWYWYWNIVFKTRLRQIKTNIM